MALIVDSQDWMSRVEKLTAVGDHIATVIQTVVHPRVEGERHLGEGSVFRPERDIFMANVKGFQAERSVRSMEFV